MTAGTDKGTVPVSYTHLDVYKRQYINTHTHLALELRQENRTTTQ